MNDIFPEEKVFPVGKAFWGGTIGGILIIFLFVLYDLLTEGVVGVREGFRNSYPFVGTFISAGIAAWKMGSSGLRTFGVAFFAMWLGGIMSLLVFAFSSVPSEPSSLLFGNQGINLLLSILVILISIIVGSVFGVIFGKTSFLRKFYPMR